MKLRFMKNPESDRPDGMLTLAFIVTIAATIRFLLDGVTVTVFDHVIAFGKVDALVYGALLTPVLGAHSFKDTRPDRFKRSEGRVDNPDQL